MSLRGFAAGWLVLSVLVLGARSTRAESAEVESLIAEGNDLRVKGQPDRALPLFQKAYALARTPRTEGQLGLAEMAVGHPIEAEQHLTAALESPEYPWVGKNRAGLEKTLALARSSIGDIVVEGVPRDAAVIVNGRAIGALSLSAPVRLAAGRVEVEVSAPGYVPSTRVLHVAGGEHRRIEVTLAKETGGSPSSSPLTPNSSTGSSAAPDSGPSPASLGLTARRGPRRRTSVSPLGACWPAAPSGSAPV